MKAIIKNGVANLEIIGSIPQPPVRSINKH